MKKLKKRDVIVSFVLMILVVLVALSNIFGSKIEILFKLKPDLQCSEDTQIHFIDVGQGDAIAIRFSNGKTMLVDSGTEDYLSKLIDYLDKIVLKGNDFIDYVVLTHPDSDHSSNMDYIVNNYRIGTFYRPKVYEEIENNNPSINNIDYRNVITAINDKDVNVKFNENGLTIIDGDISVEWFMPQENTIISATNEYSPVLIIKDNDTSAMLTGDISEDIEQMLIDKHNLGEINIDIDILKLAHHGSKYSTKYSFLKATTPSNIVISVGENTYGHPANDVLDRLLQYDKENNCKLFSTLHTTKNDGNIIYTLNKDLKMETLNNIDDYVFVSYWVYSMIIIFILVVLILIPYSKVWYHNIRFIIRNKRHTKLKNAEK